MQIRQISEKSRKLWSPGFYKYMTNPTTTQDLVLSVVKFVIDGHMGIDRQPCDLGCVGKGEEDEWRFLIKTV